MLKRLYDRLFEAFGPQHWWPGQSPFEVVVGAILTQNTSWKNVERAIANLHEDGVLQLQSIRDLHIDELAELIRPAGYYRLKARRLKNLVEFVFAEYGGSLDEMFTTQLTTLREQLLRVNGIGPETADSILLYAGELPTFVVDNYTARVLKRHGWIEPEADYYAIKDQFESELETDVELYNEFHALLVRVGNHYCRKTPKCDECPLSDMLPDSGFVEI